MKQLNNKQFQSIIDEMKCLGINVLNAEYIPEISYAFIHAEYKGYYVGVSEDEHNVLVEAEYKGNIVYADFDTRFTPLHMFREMYHSFLKQL